MRLLVCGGRSYNDFIEHNAKMNEIYEGEKPTLIIHGGASGADHLAEGWAVRAGIPTAVFKADWRGGRSAGPIRNRKMLAEGKPDAVLAFPGGRGTADMVKQAETAGIRVILAFPATTPQTTAR